MFILEPALSRDLSGIELKKEGARSNFPEGLVYDCADGFRASVFSESYLLIKKIAPEGAKNPNVVAASGLEPLTSGL